jgi:SPP1 family predicted phage head-tail adaptor
MNAGDLRHRIAVQAKTSTQDASGDPVDSWATLATIWGKVEPVRGREATYAGDQVLGEMDTRVTVRYSPASAQITQGHRLEHQGSIFNVVSVAHVRLGKQTIEILCKSGVNDG